MKFSLRTLLVIMAALSVLLASFVYLNPIIRDLYYTCGLLMVGFALISAIYHRGSRRAFWVRFIILFAGYFGHSVWPTEIRTSWMAFLNNFGYDAPGLVTNRLLVLCYQGLHGPLPKTFGNPTATGNAAAERYVAFLIVGHTAIAFVLGIFGGVIAKRLAVKMPPMAGWSSDRS